MPIDGSDIDREVTWQLAHAGPAATCQVLDLGCGDGRFLRHLADSCGCRGALPVGVDVDAPSVSQAAETAGAGRSGGAARHTLACLRADAAQLPFTGGQFDAVTVLRALHHMETPAAALGEAWRVLRPGGRLLVAEQPAVEGQPGDGCHRWSESELLALMREAGFAVHNVERMGRDLVLVIAEPVTAADGPSAAEREVMRRCNVATWQRSSVETTNEPVSVA